MDGRRPCRVFEGHTLPDSSEPLVGSFWTRLALGVGRFFIPGISIPGSSTCAKMSPTHSLVPPEGRRHTSLTHAVTSAAQCPGVHVSWCSAEGLGHEGAGVLSKGEQGTHFPVG